MLFPGRRVARSDVEHFCDGILRHALGGAQLIVPFAKGVLLGRALEVRIVRAPEQIFHGYVEVVRYPLENDGSRDGTVFLDLDVNIVVYTEFFGYL